MWLFIRKLTRGDIATVSNSFFCCCKPISELIGEPQRRRGGSLIFLRDPRSSNNSRVNIQRRILPLSIWWRRRNSGMTSDLTRKEKHFLSVYGGRLFKHCVSLRTDGLPVRLPGGVMQTFQSWSKLKWLVCIENDLLCALWNHIAPRLTKRIVFLQVNLTIFLFTIQLVQSVIVFVSSSFLTSTKMTQVLCSSLFLVWFVFMLIVT